ncbi:MAG: anthranilate synthase component I, partial [Dehalococcoidia bacterium]|nr:anthranilate synthase component I [Dehalococcoidia bacterium]
MYTPTLEQVRALGAQGNLVPIYRELPADLETPVSAFLKVARGKYSFLLESVEGGERLARYSFIGTQPYKVLKTGPGQRSGAVDPLLLIEQELSRFRPVAVAGLPRFLGGAVGYLAYEVTRYYEPRIPLPAADPLGVPESIFLFTDTLLVFDHLKHVIKVISHVHLDGEVERAYAEATERIE